MEKSEAAIFNHCRSALANGEIAGLNFNSLSFGFSQWRNWKQQFSIIAVRL
jgi:hypothetical protein